MPFHTGANCPGRTSDLPPRPWLSLQLPSPSATTSQPRLQATATCVSSKPWVPRLGGEGLARHPNPAEPAQDCSAPGTLLHPPRSPSPTRGHRDPASPHGAQLTHLQLRSCRAVCGLRPLPTTLNTRRGERRLPQGAFHSGKSHPPHGGSCFRGIPTHAKPHGTHGG